MTGPIGQTSPTFCAAGEDIQGDFKVLKDSLNTVRLDAKLKLNDSRSGIKREDNVTYNNLAKSARYVETGLKLLSKINDPSAITQKDLEDLTLVLVAQMKYIQDEYAALIVQGSSDKETGKLFRQFTNNTSGLMGEHIENFKKATQIRATMTNHTPTRPVFRGQYRGQFRGQFQPRFRFNGPQRSRCENMFL
jgi:hypothetical protein